MKKLFLMSILAVFIFSGCSGKGNVNVDLAFVKANDNQIGGKQENISVPVPKR